MRLAFGLRWYPSGRSEISLHLWETRSTTSTWRVPDLERMAHPGYPAGLQVKPAWWMCPWVEKEENARGEVETTAEEKPHSEVNIGAAFGDLTCRLVPRLAYRYEVRGLVPSISAIIDVISRSISL